MRYQLKKKLLSWRATYDIFDEQAHPAFQVVGQMISWGNKLSFLDPEGKELARIEQRLWSMLPRYQVLVGGQIYAEIRQRWSWFKRRFELTLADGDIYDVQGNFWDHEFRFLRDEATVASVSKHYFTWANTYGIDIADEAHQLPILCTTVVIDLVYSQRQAAAVSAGG